MLFLLSAVLFIFTLWAVFFFGLSRSAGALALIAASIAMPLISPWSLIFGIPLILLSLIVLIAPLRMNMITKPAYKTLAHAMPSMSSTEREALDAGTSWWEKELFMGAPDWKKLAHKAVNHAVVVELYDLLRVEHAVAVVCGWVSQIPNRLC